MQALTLLGSTGSIGTSTLDVVRQRRERFSIFALAAGRNINLLAEQTREFAPAVVVLPEESQISQFRGALKQLQVSTTPEILSGPAALVQIATAPEADVVLSAIVGVAGLEATYAAARCGKRIALANKETMVSAGALVMQAVRDAGAELIPVDSEHNGVHQCLRAGQRPEVTRLILTASGGPFRTTPATDLAHVTPAQALRHPTWKMGDRITIDSATLMNKGFEVMEACWLFDFTPDDVAVVVHPQSTVHALVEFNDGSVLAQVSATDMRMPIQYALTYPERASAPVPRIDWSTVRQWDFAPPDLGKFPLLGLAYQAQRTGGSAGCTLNAADEIAVEAFLNQKISFPGIAAVVAETLAQVPVRQPLTIGDILSIDAESRDTARRIVNRQAIAVKV